MNLLLESMTPLTVCGYQVRVWREEAMTPYAGPIDRTSLVDAADDLSMELMSGTNQLEVAKRLIVLPRVNAVEVLDESRAGVVLYKDWP